MQGKRLWDACMLEGLTLWVEVLDFGVLDIVLLLWLKILDFGGFGVVLLLLTSNVVKAVRNGKRGRREKKG